MNEYAITVALNGAPLFTTEWIENKAHALAALRELAARFNPADIHVTTRYTTRNGMAYRQDNAGDFIVRAL